MSKANVVVGSLVAAVLAVALAFALMPASGSPGGLRAIVHDGDGGTHELPLSEDAELVVTTSRGTNVVVVEGGAVRVREADCDNLDCVRQGEVDAPGRQVICLPHELWIEVVAEGGESGRMDVNAAAGSEGFDAVAR